MNRIKNAGEDTRRRQRRNALFLLLCIGLVAGISTQLNFLAVGQQRLDDAGLPHILLGAAAFCALLLSIRTVLRRIMDKSSLPDSVRLGYPAYDTLTYLVFLLTVAGGAGVLFSPVVVASLLFLFLGLQALLIYALIDAESKKELLSSAGWLPVPFLFSGFAALIYQVVWQRALFSAFGSNIESITIIVSIFMFGLGIGSLIGGVLSKIFSRRLPQLFLTFEVLIGIFGLISLRLIEAVSRASAHGPALSIASAVFGLLFFPTALMGATLPVLVAYMHRHYHNVGKSVGVLYAVNTAGSAVACFVTADVLFALLGRQASVVVAALCNFLVGFLVIKYTRRRADRDNAAELGGGAQGVKYSGRSGKGATLRIPAVLMLSLTAGYISLSQEILWFRAISYVTGGKPAVFAHVLGIFLFGIALGAMLAKKFCERETGSLITFVAAALSLSSLIYYFALPAVGELFVASGSAGMFGAYLLVGIISFLTGGIFPALCHIGVRSSDSAGLPVSWIYFANIIGATAGPLLTGFVLLDRFTLGQNILHLSFFTLLLGGGLFFISPMSRISRSITVSCVVLLLVAMPRLYPVTYSHVIEKLHFKTEYARGKHYNHLIQNRSGIIAVEPGQTDTVYGGGVYDGRFNTDPVLNSNLITRAYMIAALHPSPEEVLEIGLSSGSWARVIADYTGVKKLTIVEINPGYLELIPQYPEVSSLLFDPKVTIHIDDGRRWLNRNPGAKFDLIVMNTSFHWRDGITNLLSEEFLRICKGHLKQGGVLYYNATFSRDVPFTAAQVFSHVTHYNSFVAASDAPFSMSLEERYRRLQHFEVDGTPIFDLGNPALRMTAEKLALSSLPDEADILRREKGRWCITDDNMATEFKEGSLWFDASAAWSGLF